MSTYTFFRWLRAGAVGAIAETEQTGRAGPRATFDVTLEVQASRTYSAKKALHLHGPGDIIGLDPRQVIRRVPEPGTSTADTQTFAHVELDAPDLPWRFTPFAPTQSVDAPAFGLKTSRTLTPWICLVVVERREGVRLTYARGDPLPVLSIDGASRELPDLASAHAWAHVQLAGAPADRDAAGLAAWIEQNPQRTLSRLICPRLFEPETAYLACVVPVYALGAKAGLGEELTGDPMIDPKPTAYAWTPSATSVRLPVYHSWEFAAGAGGGFEDLVRRLERVEDLGPVGTRNLDLSTPGWTILPVPARPPAILRGALRPSGASPAWAGDNALVAAIADAIDQTAAVAPPIYGRWHAGATAVPRGGAPPIWLGQINLDPGMRVAAGLGTQIVQANQEAYMAAAWAQLGDILRANQLLRQAQAAVAASVRLHRRHLAPLDPIAALALCGPVLSRLRVSSGSRATLHGVLLGTCLGPIAFSGAARRILRTRGPLGRRISRLRDNRPFDPAEPLALLAGGARLTAPPALSPLPVSRVDAIAFALDAAGFNARGGPELAAAFGAIDARATPIPCRPVEDMAALAGAARSGVDPAVTIPRRVRGRLKMPAGLWDPPTRIDPIMAAPEIATPLFEALRRLDPEWVLPGLDGMPANSVGAVAVNQAFIEAFLVGVNHEMGREMLWRGFPTDQRCTVFSVFWDRRGSPDPAGRDITPIHEWLPASSFGEHGPGSRAAAASDRFVLLLRGDLLARFPGTTIFCVRARWAFRNDGTPYREPVPLTGGDVALPMFGGRFEPDIAFHGFGFGVGAAQGNPVADARRAGSSAGWFVVFQEQPTEPRFGIAGEVGRRAVGSQLASWRDLGTPLVITVGGRTRGDPARPVGYIDLAATTQSQAFVNAVAGLAPAWDGRSDTLAAILLSLPFRLFLHATDLVGEPEPPS